MLRVQFLTRTDHFRDITTISSSQIVMMDNMPQNCTGRYLPYAFTEHGVTMLASVLRNPTARKMNIDIVRAFVALRKLMIDNQQRQTGLVISAVG